MKPITLVAHAKPTFGNSCCKVNGKMIPPRDPPIAPRPVAYPLFSRKKWLMAASAGVKINDVPMPPRTPNTSMKCQYAVHRPMRNMLRQRHTLPARTSRRGPWASKMGPICIPQKNERKTYMPKIQPIVLSV